MHNRWARWKQWWRQEPGQKREINYLYFCSFGLFLCVLIFLLFTGRAPSLLGLPLFFLAHALGQVFLEICLLITIASVLKRWAPRWLFFLFIAFSFIALLLHYTHFTLVRLMDASLSYLFQFFFGSGLSHLAAAFQALNLNPAMIGLIAVALFLIPLAGPLFYWITHQITRLKPIRLSFLQIGIAFCSISFCLLLLDLFVHPFLTNAVYAKYQKTLPLGTTFLPPKIQRIQLPAPLQPLPNEPKDLPHLSIAQKPNLYFFIIETLRKDFVTFETAPHLTRFAQEQLTFTDSFSNANSTHLSWFALFHAQYPFHWTSVRDSWEKGSVPLRFLKELGYKIRIYSSADLQFYQMDQVLFGKKKEVIDQLEEGSQTKDLSPSERDALTFASFFQDLKAESNKEANAFFFFLDSTHSEYSVPADFPLKFLPIVKEIDYLTVNGQKEELESIKNRYRNAIVYIDHLMGRFFQTLQEEGLFDSAIIAITGDHGEEFFEEGALFHGTHLNRYQTHVPIYLKVPSKEWVPATSLATHVDLLPSILHYLTGLERPLPLAGQSLFLPRKKPYHLTITQNAAQTPYEFCLEDPQTRLHLRFSQSEQIYQDLSLEVLQAQLSPESSHMCLDSLLKDSFPELFPPLSR